jgi:hypothetical protein
LRTGLGAVPAAHVRDDVAVRVEDADRRHAAGREALLPARLAQQALGAKDRRRDVIAPLDQRRGAVVARR